MVDTSQERMRAKDLNRRTQAEQDFGDEEQESLERATRLSAKLIYEVVRRDGIEEMTRPKTSLVFSGLAAGVLIAFSVIGEALFHAYLPSEAAWKPLVESLGYTLGFLLVIKGRMQLFTENTITTVLPLMAQPCRDYVFLTGRLWAIVLSANVVGAFVAGTFMAYSGTFPPEVLESMREISETATGHPPFEAFVKAMPAGLLVAAIVWMLPTTPHNPFFIIMTFTWLIAAGGFTHIIAGSVEMAYLVVQGLMGPVGMISFFIPVLLGNIVGGTAIFTAIAWAQVAAEVEEDGKS